MLSHAGVREQAGPAWLVGACEPVSLSVQPHSAAALLESPRPRIVLPVAAAVSSSSPRGPAEQHDNGAVRVPSDLRAAVLGPPKQAPAADVGCSAAGGGEGGVLQAWVPVAVVVLDGHSGHSGSWLQQRNVNAATRILQLIYAGQGRLCATA